LVVVRDHAADAVHRHPYFEQALHRARERAEKSLSEIGQILGDRVFELHAIEGPPARTLVKLAADTAADEIVVGSRGFSSGRAALGSVSHALLHEADRPVVVLTPRAAERENRRTAAATVRTPTTELVGYDGSPAARAAFEYAVGRARRRVTVVYAYDAPPNFLGEPFYGEALRDSQQRGREILDEIATADLDAEIELDLAEGPPAEAVTRAAIVRDADEIVVGSRGHGRFRGAIGSAAHALLHEVDRPVVVVPLPRSD
jgi:nucleotide-binding universal stress UspA family protein